MGHLIQKTSKQMMPCVLVINVVQLFQNKFGL